MASLYDIPVKSIDGSEQTLAPYQGKVLVIVNTASQCGFTPQYKGLERLHRELGPKGVEVLGFPCNQFGGQEPGSATEIEQFCSTRYQTTFPLFEKTDVNGDNAHPLFKYIKHAAPGILGTEAIKWNFTKFLVDHKGQVLGRYGSADDPASITNDIQKALQSPE